MMHLTIVLLGLLICVVVPGRLYQPVLARCSAGARRAGRVLR